MTSPRGRHVRGAAPIPAPAARGPRGRTATCSARARGPLKGAAPPPAARLAPAVTSPPAPPEGPRPAVTSGGGGSGNDITCASGRRRAGARAAVSPRRGPSAAAGRRAEANEREERGRGPGRPSAGRHGSGRPRRQVRGAACGAVRGAVRGGRALRCRNGGRGAGGSPGARCGDGGGGRWRGGGAAAGGLGWEGARRSPGIAGRGGSSAGGEPRGAVSGTAGGSWGASVPRRGSVAGPGAAFRAALRSPRCAASPPPRCAPSAAPDGVHCPRVPSVPRPTARSSGLAVPAGRCRGSGGSLPLRWGRLCRCVRLFLPLSAAFPLPRSAIAAGGPRGRGSGGGSGRGARGRFPPVVLKSAGGGRRERPVRGGRLAGRIRCGAEGATVG